MKSPLIIQIERLQAEPLEIRGQLEPEVLDLVDEEHEYQFNQPVRVALKFQAVGQEVLALGAMDTTAETVCVRCLVPTQVPLHVPVQETWFHASSDKQTELDATAEHALPERTYDGPELDVTNDLRELIMSELPERAYCQPDCKGLCPDCGANLNSEPCRCATGGVDAVTGEAVTPEWKKALKNIKLE